MDRQMPRASGPSDWNEALDIISFGSPEQVIYCTCVVYVPWIFNPGILSQFPSF